jgi:hypothetical protein
MDLSGFFNKMSILKLVMLLQNYSSNKNAETAFKVDWIRAGFSV